MEAYLRHLCGLYKRCKRPAIEIARVDRPAVLIEENKVIATGLLPFGPGAVRGPDKYDPRSIRRREPFVVVARSAQEGVRGLGLAMARAQPRAKLFPRFGIYDPRQEIRHPPRSHEVSSHRRSIGTTPVVPGTARRKCNPAPKNSTFRERRRLARSGFRIANLEWRGSDPHPNSRMSLPCRLSFRSQ